MAFKTPLIPTQTETGSGNFKVRNRSQIDLPETNNRSRSGTGRIKHGQTGNRPNAGTSFKVQGLNIVLISGHSNDKTHEAARQQRQVWTGKGSHDPEVWHSNEKWKKHWWQTSSVDSHTIFKSNLIRLKCLYS